MKYLKNQRIDLFFWFFVRSLYLIISHIIIGKTIFFSFKFEKEKLFSIPANLLISSSKLKLFFQRNNFITFSLFLILSFTSVSQIK